MQGSLRLGGKMAANLSAFIKDLGHSQIAIKSIVTGKPGAQERHFQAITINKAEEFITLRNGKRQLWINLQKLKPEIGKYSQEPNFLNQFAPPRKRSIQYAAKLSFEAFARNES